MLAPAVVDEIRSLLAAGALSQRKIAKRVGVGRGTVNAIALGRRPGVQLGPDGGFLAPSGPPARCPGCGGMVQMPCLLCYVRAMKRKNGDCPNFCVGENGTAPFDASAKNA
jgi:hypothetical protein